MTFDFLDPTGAEEDESAGGGGLTPQTDPAPVAVVDPIAGADAAEPAPVAVSVETPPAPTGPVFGGPTTLDGVSLAQILHDRPDVLRAFYDQYYGPENDRHSGAWMDRVGGATPEAYANYWYNTAGKLEGYVPSGTAGEGRAAAQAPGPLPGDHVNAAGLDLDQVLRDRPDVLKAYYDDYFGANNDRHSSAWVDRVGGTTAQDYAAYWFDHYGRWEGYAQDQAGAAAPALDDAGDAEVSPLSLGDFTPLFSP